MRQNNGYCLGLIQVTTFQLGRETSLSFSSQDKVVHLKLYSDFSNVAMIPDNFNTFVLDTIKEALDEWR